MQRCDSVMASGHSVDTFAIPALQPLVLNLFVRPAKEGSELETQREVVLSMLLRVIDHFRVLSLLIHILDCFSRYPQHWHRVRLPFTYFSPHPLLLFLLPQVSSQILAALLNAMGRLSLVLDTADSMATLFHLFSAMDPSVISLKVSLPLSVMPSPTLSLSLSLSLLVGSLSSTAQAAIVGWCSGALSLAHLLQCHSGSHAHSSTRT